MGACGTVCQHAGRSTGEGMCMTSYHVSSPPGMGRRMICQRILTRPNTNSTRLSAKSTKTHGHPTPLEGAGDGAEASVGGWIAAVGSGGRDVCVTTGVSSDVADALAASVCSVCDGRAYSTTSGMGVWLGVGGTLVAVAATATVGVRVAAPSALFVCAGSVGAVEASVTVAGTAVAEAPVGVIGVRV